MNADHTPDPGFVDHLEWELTSTMHRQGSLNGTSSTLRPLGLRTGAALTLMAVSMLIGGTAAHAVMRGFDDQSAALYIARGETLLEIAQTRLAPIALKLAQAQALAEQGAWTERQLRQVETRFAQVESEAEIRELELAETLITGKEPNDALSAPLVGKRDFVSERLAARRRPMALRLELMLAQAQRNQELIDAGLASARELKAAQSEVGAAQDEVVGLETRVRLRKSFLAGELSDVQVDLHGMRVAANAARVLAVRKVEMLVEQQERFRLLSERGLVSGSELQSSEAELRTVEAQVELAELEFRILDQKLKDASGE